MDTILGSTGVNRAGQTARYGLGLLLLLALYYLLNRAGLFLQAQYDGLTPLWPSSGLTVALLWRYGTRWWPVPVLGEILTAWYLGQPSWAGVYGGAVQLFEALLAISILGRYRVTCELATIRDAVIFCFLGALAPPAASGLLGSVSLLLQGVVPSSGFGFAWFTWWLGDAMGILIVTPFLAQWVRWPLHGRRETAQWTVLILLLVAAGAVITALTNGAGDYLFFLLLPFVVWLTTRFGTAGASSASIVLTLVVLGMNLGSVTHSDFLTAVRIAFVGVGAYTGYLLGAVLNEQQRLRERLAERATHDSLTGLFNRGEFDTRLHALTSAAPNGQHALLYLDLDQFKLVNDTCGHEAGDRLLNDLARHMEKAIPQQGVLARLGGDEFGILVSHSGAAESLALAETMRRVIMDYRFQVDDLSFSLGVSIGVTWFTGGEAPSAVLSRADIACYTAKESGRNRVHAYHADDLEMRKQHSELQWISQFHAAMRDDRLRLHAQRIIPLGDSNPIVQKLFCEVLLRLQDNGRLVSPAAFLPVAERYGMLPILDHWVIEHSFQMLAEHKEADVLLSINLGGLTLDSPDFPDQIVVLQEHYGISPSRICFEVTESVAINHLTRAVESMRMLRELGYRFALDDFGSGVASFGYLQQLPVDFVKLDGRFVKHLLDDPANGIIVESLAKLARQRGIVCIAEWVESAATLDELRTHGVEVVQGYHLHRPEPLKDLLVQDAETRITTTPPRAT